MGRCDCQFRRQRWRLAAEEHTGGAWMERRRCSARAGEPGRPGQRGAARSTFASFDSAHLLSVIHLCSPRTRPISQPVMYDR